MARIIKLNAEKSELDRLIDHLFQVLPAPSHKEIADRLSQRTNRAITPAYANWLLTYLRKHENEYGWTVPHAARGKNANGNDRFFHALSRRGDTPEFAPEHADELFRGAKSTIGHMATSGDHEATAVEMAISALPDISYRRKARALVRQMKRIVEDANDLLDEMRTEVG